MKQASKGFTLIELLVVIAIIGILAALVLVALGNARDKANDARVKSNIGQLRTLAEVHYDSNGATYNNWDLCVKQADANCKGNTQDAVKAITDDIKEITAQDPVDVALANNNQAFCVSAFLKSDSTRHFCADSVGNAGEYGNSCGAAGKCQ